MHTAIMQLVQVCPKLRELDHCDFYEKRFAWRRITIIRDGEFGERVRYEVRKPPAKWVSNLATTFLYNKDPDFCFLYRGVFDVTDGAFD